MYDILICWNLKARSSVFQILKLEFDRVVVACRASIIILITKSIIGGNSPNALSNIYKYAQARPEVFEAE